MERRRRRRYRRVIKRVVSVSNQQTPDAATCVSDKRVNLISPILDVSISLLRSRKGIRIRRIFYFILLLKKRETIYHLKRFDYLGDVAYNFEQNKERKRNDRSSRGMRVKARYRGEGNGRDGVGRRKNDLAIEGPKSIKTLIERARETMEPSQLRR